jgi:Zn-dependent metalloprotease
VYANNGLNVFTFHRHDSDQREVASVFREGPEDDVPYGLTFEPKALDAETCARRYLDRALASTRIPGLTLHDSVQRATELKTLGIERVPMTGTTTVRLREVYQKVPVYGSLVTVELDEDNELMAFCSRLGEPIGGDWGGVHVNSGIHNKAAHTLLTATSRAGARIFTTSEVAAMYYLALSQYLSRTSSVADSRRAVELAARTLFQNGPPAIQDMKCQTIGAAFDAVGIV